MSSHNVFDEEPASKKQRVSEARETLVPDGNYVVGFFHSEKGAFYNRTVNYVYMEIVEGEYQGKVLFFPMSIYKNRRVAMASTMAKAWTVATGKRPPKDLYRRSPESFLKGCLFKAKVIAVTKDTDGVRRSRDSSYSRINNLIKVVDGFSTGTNR